MKGAPPPEGAGSPFTWGDRDHVGELLGDAFELSEEGDCQQPAASGEEEWELFSTSYGPTKALADSLEPERREAMRSDWVEYFDRFPAEGGGISQPRPYLLVLGTRR